MTVSEMLTTALCVILAQNLAMVKLDGIRPLPDAGRRGSDTFQMGAAVTLGMVLCAACTCAVRRLLLEPFGLGAWDVLVFILAAAALGALASVTAKRWARGRRYDSEIALCTVNCAALGAVLPAGAQSAPQYIGGAAAAGIAFLIVLTAFASLEKRLEDAEYPRAFEGLPVTLVTAAVLAAAFMGFSGIQIG